MFPIIFLKIYVIMMYMNTLSQLAALGYFFGWLFVHSLWIDEEDS